MPSLAPETPQADPGVAYVDTEDATYYNKTYAFSLRFPNREGWQLLTEKWELSRVGPWPIFAASNPTRFMNLFFTIEDVGVKTSNEDHQLATEQALLVVIQNAEVLVGFEQMSLEPTTVNAHEALIWTYKLTIEKKGRDIVWTQAFFHKDTRHYRVMIVTLGKAYERRKEEIHSIIDTFNFLAPAKQET